MIVATKLTSNTLKNICNELTDAREGLFGELSGCSKTD